jgi:arabinose-5-phosphate isomerase
MKLEDLKSKQISELMSLIVDLAPTTKPNDELSTTAKAISSTPYKIAVAVDNNGGVVGVLTGSDIVKAFSEKKPIALTEQTAKIMNRNVVGVDVSETMSQLVSKLSTNRIREIVVTDKGKYVGVIDRQKLADNVRQLLK